MKGSKSHTAQIRELNHSVSVLTQTVTDLKEDVSRLKQEQGRNHTLISIAITHLATVLRWAYINEKPKGETKYLTKLLVAGKGVAACFGKTQ